MINVEYCPIEDRLADVMTKKLTCERHERLLRLMGVGLCPETPTLSRIGKMNATAWKLPVGAKHYAIPMVKRMSELLIFAIPIAIGLP